MRTGCDVRTCLGICALGARGTGSGVIRSVWGTVHGCTHVCVRHEFVCAPQEGKVCACPALPREGGHGQQSVSLLPQPPPPNPPILPHQSHCPRLHLFPSSPPQALSPQLYLPVPPKLAPSGSQDPLILPHSTASTLRLMGQTRGHGHTDRCVFLDTSPALPGLFPLLYDAGAGGAHLPGPSWGWDSTRRVQGEVKP